MSRAVEDGIKFINIPTRVEKRNKQKFVIKTIKYHPDGSGRDYLVAQSSLDVRNSKSKPVLSKKQKNLLVNRSKEAKEYILSNLVNRKDQFKPKNGYLKVGFNIKLPME